MSIIDKLPLTSHDIAADRLEQLRAIFPEVFAEGKIDHDALHRALGQWIDPSKERFGLNWPGKADCMRVIQSPSIGTLLPMPEESVNFDTSENLIIEGDNLEVLKLLQTSYYGKIKMIYIDPPYNTGNEFIYPDNYREGLDEYLKFSGQVDAEGYKTSTNTETGGRYHSRWLSMMYPRLFLAKNLLRDDGVIFVSIDDNEVHNLRALMNEVFGEENFLGCIAVVSNLKGRSDDKYFATAHNSLLAYSTGKFVTRGVPIPEEYWDDYPETDCNGKRFRLLGLRKRGSSARREDRPSMYFPIYVDPVSKKVTLKKNITCNEEVLPKLSDGSDGRWRWGKESVELRLDELMAARVGTENRWDVFQIDYAETEEGVKRIKPKSIWMGSEFANESGTLEVKQLLGKGVFDNPKPIGILSYCLEQSIGKDDLVLDFFAGSGTTAHAVLDLNKKDNGNRKFILVQLPEKTDNKEYPTIANITRERVRRVIKKMNDADTGKLDFDDISKQDRGFKSFHLSSSNFKVWDGDAAKTADVSETLSLFTDNIIAGRSQDAILYELLLKAGFPLSAPLEKLTLAGKEVFSIDCGKLLVCLDKDLTLKVIEAMVAKGPKQILCLDEGFRGNDQLKVNVVQTVKAHNRREEADIVFRVV